MNNQDSYQMDMANLESAIYYIKIMTEKGTITKRIVKE